MFEGSFGETGSGNGQLSKPIAVAVEEQAGDLYVVDQGNDRVERFSSAGAYIGQFDASGTLPGESGAAPTGRLSAPEGIAIDNSCYFRKLSGAACASADPSNGDVYVVDAGHDVIDKFSPQGVYIGQLTSSEQAPFSGIDGVATDANGTVWVYEEEGFSRGVDEFDDALVNGFVSTRETKISGSFAMPVFAVGCKGTLFVGREGHEAGAERLIAEFTSRGTVLTESVDPAHSAAGAAVEPGTCDLYVDNFTSIGRLTPEVPAVAIERLGSSQLAGGGGLSVSIANEDRVYAADSAANAVHVFALEPPGPPTVGEGSVSGVTATSATFRAEVNPRGAASQYRFEYGRCASAEACASSAYESSVPVPEGQAGSEFEALGVSAHPQGLQPGGVYHERVVAHNGLGSVDGEEVQFTTQPAGAFSLPDNRIWELVSPPQKHGAKVESDFQGELVIQAAAGGDAVTYLTTAPTETNPQGFATFMQVLSMRGPTGWSSRDIGIPHPEATGQSIGQGSEYRAFSTDLGAAAVQPAGSFDQSLSAHASEQTAFLRTDFAGSGVACTGACYRPLVVGCPPVGEACPQAVEEYADVPAGTVFGTKTQCPPTLFSCGPEFQGASPDLAHVVVSSAVPLTPGAAANSLYEWSGGALLPASVMPPGEGGKTVAGSLGESGMVARAKRVGAISQDGSRVVWTSNAGGLYVSDPTTGEAVRLDAVQGGSGVGSPSAFFQLASADGSKVLFTDGQQLTGGSGASASEPDLYQCEVVVEGGGLACRLSDLTPASEGEHADVQGMALGAGEDGSRVYFVARGVLASNHNSANEAARAGEDNLYVSHAGATTFVAVLSASDADDWAGGHIQPYAYVSTARVSPNGAWLAFMSQRSLTGYDNRDAIAGRPDEEVYLYDAESERVVCASCNPTGGRPLGVPAPPKGVESLTLGADGVWDNSITLAANVPGWTSPLYQSRYLSDNGRLFFNSHEALVPQDVDGTWDVYEYEPPGVGSCSTSASSFSPRSGGCVNLISAGTSSEESAFLDASENGGDVFFVTASQLVPSDLDTALDVYDAHECTGSSPCASPVPPPPPSCTTEASCRPEVTPQPEIFGSPSSQTFLGPVSAAPAGGARAVPKKGCKRGYVKRHGKCVRHRSKGKKSSAGKKASARARKRG